MTKHDEHHGLAQDLEVLRQSSLKRRDVMRWAVSTSLLTLAGCPEDSSPMGDGSGGTTEAGRGRAGGASGAAAGRSAGGAGGAVGAAAGRGGAMGGSSNGSCTAIPEEIVGPYPADGSNSASSAGGPPPDFDPSKFPGGFPGAPDGGLPPGLPPMDMMPMSDSDGGVEDLLNALVLEGIVRSDIRSGIAGAKKVAEGVPFTVKLKLVNAADGCTPVSGLAVYVWHCDRAGDYSLYSAPLVDENYLRGVQATDKAGEVTFKTIVPGCYAGRWPHFHLEVYPSLAKATEYKGKFLTTQLAMPKDVCDAAYAESGYENSAKNLAPLTLEGDMIFADGYESELLNVTGSVAKGYTADLTFGVKPS